ncbi:MAG: exo-alpha-sialidase [Bryobacterales bacterium]|nr:exo-alpha-sialidase [Bryobacterales bacterium]
MKWLTLLLPFLLAAQDAPLVLHPKVLPMEHLKAAPYVKLADGSDLTVVETEAFITQDDGWTWQAHPIFAAGERLKVSNERALVRTKSGAIILAFMNIADRHWAWDEAKNAPQEGAYLHVWTMRSLDEGRTWQDARIVQRGYCGAIRQMIQTRSGRVVLAAQNLDPLRARHYTITYSSDDDGLTWNPGNVLDVGGRGHHDGSIEPTLTELRDGRLWMLLRTNWDFFWQAHSVDEGRYWHSFGPTMVEASSAPGFLQRLASGRLAFAWNRLYPEGQHSYRRRGDSFSERPASLHREELSLAFSNDDGKTWTAPVVIARQKDKWLSYPWIYEPRPGELWITTMQGALRVGLKEADFVQ